MEPPPVEWQSSFKSAVLAWNHHGSLGVDIFFVLSGFLVSGLLFGEYRKRGEISVSRFYIRRAWKIYPPFYALIAFSFFYATYVVGYAIPKGVAYAELFFFQNYAVGFWNHTWSLAVEEHFYIALPLLLLFLVRSNRGAENPFRAIPFLVVAVSIVLLSVRVANFLMVKDYSNYSLSFPTHLRIDSLFFGVAVAYAYQYHPRGFRRTFQPWRFEMVVIGGAILMSFIWVPNPGNFYAHTFGFTQSYLGAAILLIGVLMCEIPNNRVTTAISVLGTFSYSIYLWHMVLMYWAIPQLKNQAVSWEMRTSVFIVGAFVIGIVMTKLVELPTLHIRDRLFPARTNDMAAGVIDAADQCARLAA